MTPAEEDALVAKIMRDVGFAPVRDSIRLAIRAAVAHERERCANLVATMAERPYDSEPEFSALLHAEVVIRRGE